jgi:hypothetical protein
MSMLQPFSWIATTLANAGSIGTGYLGLLGGHQNNSALIADPIAVAGDLQNFFVRLENPVPVGSTIVFTVMHNGSATAHAWTLTAGATSGGAAGPLTVAKGDRVFLRQVVSGASHGSCPVRWGCEFVDAGGAGMHSGYAGLQSTVGWAVRYSGLFSPRSGVTTIDDAKQIVACDGTFTGLTVMGVNANIQAGRGFRFYINLNGVRQDGSGSTVNTETFLTGVSANVAVNGTFTLPVVRGDLVTVEIQTDTTTGSVSSNNLIQGVAWSPTITGQTTMGHRIDSPPGGSGTLYSSIQDQPNTTGWASTLTFTRAQEAPAGGLTLTKPIMVRTVAPGVGTTTQTSIQVNGALPTGTPTFAINGTAVSGEDSSTRAVVLGAGDTFGWQCDSTSAAGTSGNAYWSVVAAPWTATDREGDGDIEFGAPDLEGDGTVTPPPTDVEGDGDIEFGGPELDGDGTVTTPHSEGDGDIEFGAPDLEGDGTNIQDPNKEGDGDIEFGAPDLDGEGSAYGPATGDITQIPVEVVGVNDDPVAEVTQAPVETAIVNETSRGEVTQVAVEVIFAFSGCDPELPPDVYEFPPCPDWPSQTIVPGGSGALDPVDDFEECVESEPEAITPGTPGELADVPDIWSDCE